MKIFNVMRKGLFQWAMFAACTLFSTQAFSQTPVTVLDSWTIGTTHNKVAGTNRALVVLVHGEHATLNMSVTTVTYGGQTMTKVVEKNQGTGSRSYTGAFILNEAGVNAALNGTIAVTWGVGSMVGSDVISVLLQNVNQTTLVGASSTGGIDPGLSVSVSPSLATAVNDMVIVGGTAASNATFNVSSGYTKGIESSAFTWGDIVGGYKSATGAAETPGVTISTSMRLAVLGFVVKASTNTAPTVATPAAASPSPATGLTTTLSALGADNAGEAALTYTWATTGTPPAAVTFSANGNNAAKSTLATFTKAGAYNFLVTIRDAGNLTVTSSVSVTVNQTLSTITVTPANPSVTVGTTQTFIASGVDQFGTSMTATYIWSLTGTPAGTSINSSTGVLTAGTTAGGPFIITATSSSKTGTTNVTVVSIGTSYVYPTGCTAGQNMKVDGSVVIGTVTAPTEALEVGGKIKCSALMINNLTIKTPDYVFEKDYNLRSIGSLEAFIADKKHLPEVPSAKDMEQNGVDLSELNMTLLKKVEELTLYVIEQNKAIAVQNKKIEELEKIAKK